MKHNWLCLSRCALITSIRMLANSIMELSWQYVGIDLTIFCIKEAKKVFQVQVGKTYLKVPL